MTPGKGLPPPMPARPRGRSAWLGRGMRLRLGLLLYTLRKIGPSLVAVVAYMLAAACLLRWDLRRTGHSVPDFESTLFSTFMLLSFQALDPFPPTTASRMLFWFTPFVGIALFAEGLLKVGASLFDSAARREVWVSIVTDQLRDHVIVCGLGHVGYRVTEELRQLGEDVVAIEQREGAVFVAAVRAKSVPVHIGDARRDDLLETVGVARAKAVVCATSDDLANLEIALDSKRMNPKIRVVMRMFDQRLAGKVGGALELDESFSTSALAAPLIAMQATQEGVRSAYRLGETVRVTAEIAVAPNLGEATVYELEERGAFRIVSLRRSASDDFGPVRANDRVRGGDVLIVDTAAMDLPAARYQLSGT